MECGVFKQRGVSLLEMMIVLVVLVVLISLAYPSFRQMLHGMEAKRIRNTLMVVLKEARLVSATHRQNLIVCLADKDNQCHNRAKDKVILFVDDDNNQRLDGDELLKEYALNTKYGNIEMNVSARRHYMKYFGDSGVPRGHFGHIKYCSVERPQFDYKITITAIGYVWDGKGCN